MGLILVLDSTHTYNLLPVYLVSGGRERAERGIFTRESGQSSYIAGGANTKP